MIKIDAPRLVEDGHDVVVVAKITGLEQTGSLRFRLPIRYAPAPEAMADAMLPVGLMLSMASKQDLDLVAPEFHNFSAPENVPAVAPQRCL